LRRSARPWQGRAEVRHGRRPHARLLGDRAHQARQPGQGQLDADQASRRGRRAGQSVGPTDEDRSIASGRTMVEIANGKGKAATPFMTARARTPARSGKATATTAPRRAGQAGEGNGGGQAQDRQGLPDFIEPQLTKPLEKPPAGPGWAHEIKFDGYRMQLRTQGGKAALRTRKGLDWSAKFPEIIAAGARAGDGIIDGEIVRPGRQRRPGLRGPAGGDLRGRDRRAGVLRLRPAVRGSGGSARPAAVPAQGRGWPRASRRRADPALCRSLHHAGDAVLLSACRMDLEGIVSKRLDAPYRSGRGETWTKSKCRAGHEVVIGGYTTTNGSVPVADRRGQSRRQALAHRPDRHRLWPREGRGDPAAAEGSGDRQIAVRGQGRAEPRGKAWRGPLGASRTGRRNRVRGASPPTASCAKPPSRACARTSRPGGRGRDARPGGDQGRRAQGPKGLHRSSSAPTVSPKGSAVVMGQTISNAGKTLWPDA
jgi:bifunctional non-homologous end joining protein LigD